MPRPVRRPWPCVVCDRLPIEHEEIEAAEHLMLRYTDGPLVLGGVRYETSGHYVALDFLNPTGVLHTVHVPVLHPLEARPYD